MEGRGRRKWRRKTYSISSKEVRTPSFLRAKGLEIILRRERKNIRGDGKASETTVKGREREKAAPSCKLQEAVAASDLSHQTPVSDRQFSPTPKVSTASDTDLVEETDRNTGVL